MVTSLQVDKFAPENTDSELGSGALGTSLLSTDDFVQNSHLGTSLMLDDSCEGGQTSFVFEESNKCGGPLGSSYVADSNEMGPLGTSVLKDDDDLDGGALGTSIFLVDSDYEENTQCETDMKNISSTVRSPEQLNKRRKYVSTHVS